MKDNLSRAQALSDMVAYQPGSVVSRTIMDTQAGMITLFSFDEGQGLSEHTTPFDAFVYIVDGQAEITISGENQVVHNNEMIIMPAGKPHALKAVKPFKMMLVMIRAKE